MLPLVELREFWSCWSWWGEGLRSRVLFTRSESGRVKLKGSGTTPNPETEGEKLPYLKSKFPCIISYKALFSSTSSNGITTTTLRLIIDEIVPQQPLLSIFRESSISLTRPIFKHSRENSLRAAYAMSWTPGCSGIATTKGTLKLFSP